MIGKNAVYGQDDFNLVLLLNGKFQLRVNILLFKTINSAAAKYYKKDYVHDI